MKNKKQKALKAKYLSFELNPEPKYANNCAWRHLKEVEA